MWLVALFALLFVSLMVFDFVQRPKRARAAQEARERRLAEVARRGWTLEVTQTGNSNLTVYSGTTDGVPWRCEMNLWRSPGGYGRTSQEKVFTHWSAPDAVLPRGILAVWPNFGGAQIDVNVPQFVMNLVLGPLVRALGADAATAELLTTATVVTSDDPALNARYLLRATDARLMHRFLDAGARGALIDAAAWLPERSKPHHLVLMVAGAQGLSILLSGWVDDMEYLERVAGVGARLATAHRAT